MKTYHDELVLQFDEVARGNAASGELVTVFDAGLLTKPSLFDVNGAPIANPITTDPKGNYSFQVSDGNYDIVGRAGTGDETRRDNVNISDVDAVVKVFYAENYDLNTLVDFNKIQNDMIASGSQDIKLVFTDKVTFVGSQAIGIDISNINSFTAICMDVEDTFVYPNTQQSTLFKLTNVKSVSINGNAKSTLPNPGTAVSAEKVSLTVVKVNGCDTFVRVGSNIQTHRDYEVQNTKNIFVRTVNLKVMYPNLVFNNCGVLDIDSVNTECRRDVFIYNATGGDVVIDSTDMHLWSLIKHFVDPANPTRETSNLDIKYKVRGTSPSGRHGARSAPISIDVNTDPATTSPQSTVRNINIEYDVDSDLGAVIGVIKQFNDELNGDNTARGYVLQNISVRGRYISNVDDQGFYFNFKSPSGGGASWVAGDLISNINFKDLAVVNRGGASGFTKVNLEEVVEAVTAPDHIFFDNVSSPDGRFDAADDFGDAVIYKDTEFEVFTTKNSEATARTLSVRNNFFKILVADAGVKQIATIPNFRAITSVQIEITAYRDPDTAGNVVAGTFSGVVLFASTPPGIIRNGWTETFGTQPGLVNPVLLISDAGLLSVDIPEWSGSDIQVVANIKLSYNQHTSPNGELLVGLVNKSFTIDV